MASRGGEVIGWPREQGLDVGRAVIRTDSKMYNHAMKEDTEH